MKTFSSILILLTFFAAATTAQNVETQIKDVTVYRNGALVGREGKISLPKGNTTLFLDNLSTELDPNTLRIGIADNAVKILSVKHEIVVIDNENAQKKDIDGEKRIAALKDSISYLVAQMSVFTSEEALIKANQNIGGQQNGVSAAELKAMTDFYKKELSDIAVRKITVNKQIQKYKDEVVRLINGRSCCNRLRQGV